MSPLELALLLGGTALVVGGAIWATSGSEGPATASGGGSGGGRRPSEGWLDDLQIPIVEPSPHAPLEEVYLNCDYAQEGLPRGTPLEGFAAVQPALLAASEEFGVPLDLLNAIAWQESRFDTRAVSYAGAQGLMQLMPTTGRPLYEEIGIDGEYDPFDPNKAARAAALYMRRRLDHYSGRFPAEPHKALYFAVASYNTGQGNVDKFLAARARGEEAQLHPETRDYTPKVLGALPYFTRVLETCG